ncbi:MAG: restriction endonuclease [Acidobacteria bacterium]|nr:restriction endonuclease [Acidobacteriota bacterium]
MNGARELPVTCQELRIDATYRNTNDWKKSEDVFNRFFRFADGKGINNTSGFRPKSRAGKGTDITKCAFCVLVTTFGESEWPDSLDRESGLFTYFGDNRSKGVPIHDTTVGGNRLLRSIYSLLHTGQRGKIPPFLCFETLKSAKGTHMRFLGLACPGAEGVSALEDLVAVWRIKGNDRFQNYRAMFTILREETVSRSWLEDLVAGTASVDSKYCPPTWSKWVSTGRYLALQCSRRIEPRSRKDQEPSTKEERMVLLRVHQGLSDREFEFAAADLVRLMDERFSDFSVTRATRDGGRDVVAEYRVGHALHQVRLEAYVEAKRWSPGSAVGVKPMMRLISRLKHRDIGVFITTSYFDVQVQRELIEDRHPVLLVSGGDVARLLLQKELGHDPALGEWLHRVRDRSGAGASGPTEGATQN